MKVSRIEVMPHARSPIGSFAVVRLIGIDRLEGPAAFQLVPLTTPGQASPAGWPNGNLKPLGVRAGSDAVELLIGPDIVKAEPLKPGTPVRFLMPSAEVDVRIEWPDLSGKAIAEPVSSHAAHSMGINTQPPNSGLRPTASTPNSAMAPTVPVDGTKKSLARLQPRGAAAQLPPPVPPPAETVSAKATPESDPVVKTKGTQPPMEDRHHAPAQPAVVAPQRRSSLLPFALSFVIVAAVLVAAARFASPDGAGVTLFSIIYSAVTREKQAAPVQRRSSLALGEILEVGNVSPAGVDASGMTRREALERANRALSSIKTPADRLEVAFWLRKALSTSLSEPRLVWAVTQLGAAYASSDEKNKPNYEAARLLWMWAADAGDAQAACFLGRLYEQGLGVPRDVNLAREQYVQAQYLGGCPGLDQAMLRMKSKTR